MKRFITALLAGGLVFGATLGAAATLNVDGGVLQTGSDADLTCDDKIGVGFYGLEGDAGGVPGQVAWNGVQLNGIDAACEGVRAYVRIFNGNTEIWRGIQGNDIPQLTGASTQQIAFSTGTTRGNYQHPTGRMIRTADITRVDVNLMRSGSGN